MPNNRPVSALMFSLPVVSGQQRVEMSISPQKIQAIACFLSSFVTEEAWCVFPLLCSCRWCVQLLPAWCPKVGGCSVQGLLSTCSRTFPRSPFILQALSCYWISSYSSISICLFPATVPRLPVDSAAVQFSWSLFFWERFVLTSCPIPPPSYSSLGPAPFSLPNSSRKHQPSLVTSLHSHLGDCWLRLTTLDTTTSFCAERELRKSIITAKVPPALSCNGKPNLEQGQLCNFSALKSRNVEKYLGICLTALIIFQ